MHPMVGLSAIILAGLIVRLVEIDRWPLWSDEALTLLIAQWPVRMLFFAPVDPTPGLYYSLHKLFVGPDAGAATARSISLVCGTFLIPAAYFLAREARIPALLAAALVALSFPLVDYSQEARAYSLLILLVTLSAAFFVRWTRSREPWALLATLFACLLAFYSHFASVFWIGPVVLAVYWFGRRQTVTPLLLTAVLAVPEMMRLARYSAGPFMWLAQATPAQAADTLAKALLPFRPGSVWLLLAALLIGWRAWANRSSIRGWARANSGAATAILILAAVPLLAWLFGLVSRPVFMTRTILVSVPGFLLAMALLLKFEQRVARFAVVGTYAASLLITGTTRPKENWDQVAERVVGDPVLMCQPGEVAAMRHILAGNNRIFLYRKDGLAEMPSGRWQRSYFEVMTDPRQSYEAFRLGRSVQESLFPVWPVRSGWALSASPMSLGQAKAVCQGEEAGRQARYIAD